MLDKPATLHYVPTGVVISNTPRPASRITGWVVHHVQEKLWGVMNEWIHPISLVLPDFIIQKNDGVYIDISKFKGPRELQQSIDMLFWSGHILTDFDYESVSELLFGEKKLQDGLIKVASTIVKGDPKRQHLYRNPIISRDKKSVQYFFESVFVEELNSDSILVEHPATLNIDEFIAYLWTQWIRHGIHTDIVKWAIQSSKKWLIIIAEETSPSLTHHPKLESVISFEIKQWPKNGNTNVRTDLLDYEQGYVRIDADKPIYKKNPWKIGDPGWTIFGEKIEAEPIQDFDLSVFAGNGVTLKKIDGVEYLYSLYNWFPRIEEWLVSQGRQKIQQVVKIHIDSEKVFDSIGMQTGRVQVDEGIVSENDILLDVSGALTIYAKKNVEANIRAKDDIIIDGSIFGTACSSVITRKRQYVGVNPKWSILSENGNIVVWWNINDGVLEARNGNINAIRVENSLVIGKTVTIEDMAYNSTIIAETVIIQTRAIGCRIIAKNIVIQQSEERWHHENVISVFLHDYSVRIEELHQSRQQLIDQVQAIESRIDHDIVLKFRSLEKFDAGKRRSMTRILVEIMNDPSKKEDSKYSWYIQIYNSLEPLLRTYGLDWQKIKKLNQALNALTQEMNHINQKIEQEQSELQLEIGSISARTLVRTLAYRWDLNLLSLTPEQIMELSDCQIDGDMAKSCILDTIFDASSGGLNWKMIH